VPELAAQLVLARHGLARENFQNLSLPKSFLYAHVPVMREYARDCIIIHDSGILVSTKNPWCDEFSPRCGCFRKSVRAIDPEGGRALKEKPNDQDVRCFFRGTRTNRCDRRSTSSPGQSGSLRPVPTREARIGRPPDLRRKRKPRRSFSPCGYFKPLSGCLILNVGIDREYATREQFRAGTNCI
jgi:hypothetical protein